MVGGSLKSPSSVPEPTVAEKSARKPPMTSSTEIVTTGRRGRFPGAASARKLARGRGGGGGGGAGRPRRMLPHWHPFLAAAGACGHEEEPRGGDAGAFDGFDNGQQAASGSSDSEVEVCERRARRPMNAFLIFCKRHRAVVRAQHPRLDNRGATKILAEWWGGLPGPDKQVYTDLAREYKDAFLRANPGYRWCPSSAVAASAASHHLPHFPRSQPSGGPCHAGPRRTGKAIAATPDAASAQTGGLGLLLLAGETALNGSPNEAPSTQAHQSHRPAAAEACGNSALFQLAEMCSDRLSTTSPAAAKHAGRPPAQRVAGTAASSAAPFLPDGDRSPPAGRPGKARRKRRKRRQRLARDGAAPASPPATVAGENGPRGFFATRGSCVDLTIDSVAKGGADGCDEAEPDDDDDDEAAAGKVPVPLLTPTFPAKVAAGGRKAAAARAERFVTEAAAARGGGGAGGGGAAEELATTHGARRRGGTLSAELCPNAASHAAELAAEVQDGFFNVRRVKMEAGQKMESRQEQAQEEPPGLAAVKTETFDDDHVTAKAKHITSADGGFTQRTLQRGPPHAASHDALGPPHAVSHDALGPGGASDGEQSGSRKSKRTCKGALYKTLVLEGMLTTLRANLDRGKKGFRGLGEEPQRSREEERVSPVSPRRLKRTRSKDADKPRLGSLQKELEEKLSRLPTALPPSKKPLPRSPGGPSSKKQPFHKIVSKYKHKRDAAPTPACVGGGGCRCAPHRGEPPIAAPPPPPPPPALSRKGCRGPGAGIAAAHGGGGSLTGSQKRKARKSRITHLVRSADGHLSPMSDKAAASSACPCERGTSDESASVPGTPTDASLGTLSSFFSLAALAEVAAMETSSRPQASNRTREGQAKEISQTPLYISCMD